MMNKMPCLVQSRSNVSTWLNCRTDGCERKQALAPGSWSVRSLGITNVSPECGWKEEVGLGDLAEPDGHNPRRIAGTRDLGITMSLPQ